MDVTATLGPETNERLRLSGTKAGDRGPRPRTYRAGRVCQADGCATLLSSYNRSPRCWLHEPARSYLGPVRGRRPAPIEVVHDLGALGA